MNHKEHNGWYNYETWAVALWLDNEQGSQEYWAEIAGSHARSAHESEYCTAKENAATDLAEVLKEHHEEALPELPGFAADLLNAAMSEVNWREIAKHLITDALAESKA